MSGEARPEAMQLFATEAGAWAVLGTFLMAFVTALTVISHLMRIRRANVWDTVEDWKRTSEANEARVQVLERELKEQKVFAEDARRDVYNVTILFEDMKRKFTASGLRELDQQRQIDRLNQREKQLVAAIERLGGEVPEPARDDR